MGGPQPNGDDFRAAVGRAVVSRVVVPVVAFLRCGMQEAIAAGGSLAGGGTVVVGVGVPVITLFGSFDDAVTADGELAIQRAVVRVDVVSVVALFHPFVHEPVTTHRLSARGEARVVVRLVSVVALLHSFVHEAVAAPCFAASRRACVVVGVVPVIAVFTGIHHAISARAANALSLVAAPSTKRRHRAQQIGSTNVSERPLTK